MTYCDFLTHHQVQLKELPRLNNACHLTTNFSIVWMCVMDRLIGWRYLNKLFWQLKSLKALQNASLISISTYKEFVYRIVTIQYAYHKIVTISFNIWYTVWIYEVKVHWREYQVFKWPVILHLVQKRTMSFGIDF